MWDRTTKIQGTPGMSFTIEGFDFDNDVFIGDQTDVEEIGSIPITPDGPNNAQSPIHMDWTDSESHPVTN